MMMMNGIIYATWYPALYTSTPGRPIHSDTNLSPLGGIQPHCNLCAKTSLALPLLSIARYSFIPLSELGRRGENENAQALKQQQMGFEPSIESPAFYRRAAAPHMTIFRERGKTDYVIYLSQGLGSHRRNLRSVVEREKQETGLRPLRGRNKRLGYRP